MFGVVNPGLLYGLAAIAIPIAIHLLLRSRPRPRAWAAMRWLLAAMQRAQRRWKLTNLLLLLLRCLAVALAALALARPNWSLLGQGGQVALVIDLSASMGARQDQAGPLDQAVAALGRATLGDRVTLITVSDRVRVVSEGPASEAVQALGRLSAQPIPGGLDRAAAGDASGDLLGALSPEHDVILVSDFQQDDGSAVVALVEEHVHSVRRWSVGEASANLAVAGIERLPDPLPGQADECVLRLHGATSAPLRLSVDGGPAAAAGEDGRVNIPPLDAGDHRLAIEIQDERGLVYDNRLELPLRVRGQVPVLIASEHSDYLAASLLAANSHFAPPASGRSRIMPAEIAAQGLPPRGLLVLRGRSGDDARLARWVADGGVLWANRAVLAEETALAGILDGLVLGEAAEGLPYQARMRDLDEAFAVARPALTPTVTSLPAGSEALLWSGDRPVVVAIPRGRGQVVVEFVDLVGDSHFTANGATPLWVRRCARRLTASADQPLWWEAGAPGPETATLRRAGLSSEAVSGVPLLLEPGIWTREDGRQVVVVPSAVEARIDRAPPPGTLRDLSAVLPDRSGADLGPILLALLLVLLLAEGAFAAWAGRRYGG